MDEKIFCGNILQNPKYKREENSETEIVSEIHAATEIAAHTNRMGTFAGNRGHGTAGESGNTVVDKAMLRNADTVGYSNEKNGADRIVDGILIQTKYCKTARASVNAAFEKGTDGKIRYRYYDKNDVPMQLEVPKGQYNEAVKIMRKRIAEGKVPNVSDPDRAESLIREGNIKYETACRIAKAGNIDSLMFDMAHGVVIGTSALGISAVITYAQATWQHKTPQKALDMAIYSGIKMGGLAFMTTVISSQLTRTAINKSLLPVSNEIVKRLPSDLRQIYVNTLKEGAPIYGAAASKNLARLLRNNIIADAVALLVLSADDISNFLKGCISAKQLFKNLMTLVGGLGGSYIGAIGGVAIGAIIPLPGSTTAGLWIGRFVGGSIGGSVTCSVMNEFFEDDAEEMVQILNERLILLAEDYLLNKIELEIVISELQSYFDEKVLLKMFASEDRKQFADKLLTKIIDSVIRQRAFIVIPRMKQIEEGLIRTLDICNNRYLRETNVIDEVQAVRNYLGNNVPDHVVKKAAYAAIQMDTVLRQTEMLLKNPTNDEISGAVIENDNEVCQLEAERLKEKENFERTLEYWNNYWRNREERSLK